MRKTISILMLIASLMLTLSACGFEKTKIEDYEWKMRTIMHVEGDQVVYDAVAEKSSTQPEAKTIEMRLYAIDGKIRITDITNDNIYEGSYTVLGRNPEGTEYCITIENKTGHAVVAMTTYADGTEEPTLPISLDGYSMYFYAK